MPNTARPPAGPQRPSAALLHTHDCRSRPVMRALGKTRPGSGLGSDVSRARSFRRWLFIEADALTFVQLLEPTRRHRAAVKEPLLAAIVANEAESAIPNQPFDRAVRHVDVPPQAIDGSPYGYAIKFHSTIRSTRLKVEHTPPRGQSLELTSGWLECEDPLRCR